MIIIKNAIFILILIYASWYDLKKLTVPTHVHILLFITGLLNVSLLSFISLGITFIPLFLIVLFIGGIGGGDIKYAGFCSFVFQDISGFIGTVIGLTLACIIAPIIKRIKKQSMKEPFALVPYLSLGYLIILILGGIN